MTYKEIKKPTSRYVRLGTIGVDAGTILLADPCYLHENIADWFHKKVDMWAKNRRAKDGKGEQGLFADHVHAISAFGGVLAGTGGDGGFDVYGKFTTAWEYDGKPQEELEEIVIRFKPSDTIGKPVKSLKEVMKEEETADEYRCPSN